MSKNILIVDDSALMRRVTSDIIEADGRFRVKDTASDGLKAIDKIVNNYGEYDAVILDINMPRMNGLEVLEKLKKLKINVKVVVSSTVAIEGAYETIRALELGAFDFVTKPASFSEIKKSDFDQILIEKLVVATGIEDYEKEEKDILQVINKDVDIQKISKIKKEAVLKTKKSKLIFIASSTGGPVSLQQVVPKLPKNIDAPVIVVQHMPIGFTASLAARLDELSHLKVKETENGEALKAGTVYIAKGGHQLGISLSMAKKPHLVITESKLTLKPCADITLESLIDSPFDEIICVVMTGMGSDGTRGILKLKEHKDVYIIAQDQESCVVYGMPKMIANTGLVDEVVPLSNIADKIIKNAGVR